MATDIVPVSGSVIRTTCPAGGFRSLQSLQLTAGSPAIARLTAGLSNKTISIAVLSRFLAILSIDQSRVIMK